jgi:hypothetical protein
MKIKSTIIVTCIFILTPYILHSADLLIQPPPQSMNKFYSESGKTSEWIEQMREISKAFGAAFISMEKNNWEEAFKNAQDFGSAYQKSSQMVPEWKDLFDLESSEFFIASIQSQDKEKINQFSTKLKKTCAKCHSKHNISVWVRFHWPSIRIIKVLDPIDEQEVDYRKFMYRLSSSFKNIEIFFDQKNYNDSWKAIDVFSKQLRALRSVCSKCHVTEWTKSSKTVKDFFVGEDMIDALQQIKQTFASGTPDPKLFQKNIEYISRESCKMCHLVHQPAAIIQRAWKN